MSSDLSVSIGFLLVTSGSLVLAQTTSANADYKVRADQNGYFISQVDFHEVTQLVAFWDEQRNIHDYVDAFLRTDPYEFGREKSNLAKKLIAERQGDISCVDQDGNVTLVTEETKPGELSPPGEDRYLACELSIGFEPKKVENLDCIFWRNTRDYWKANSCYVQVMGRSGELYVIPFIFDDSNQFDSFHTFDVLRISGETVGYYSPLFEGPIYLQSVDEVILLAETPIQFNGPTLGDKMPLAAEYRSGYAAKSEAGKDVYSESAFSVK
jgi:hypothetical protein